MHELMNNFSLSPYVWIGVGVFLTLLFTKRAFRNQIDAVLARMLNLKARQQPKDDVDEEE